MPVGVSLQTRSLVNVGRRKPDAALTEPTPRPENVPTGADSPAFGVWRGVLCADAGNRWVRREGFS
jgi:hypothetical protein